MLSPVCEESDADEIGTWTVVVLICSPSGASSGGQTGLFRPVCLRADLVFSTPPGMVDCGQTDPHTPTGLTGIKTSFDLGTPL